MNPPENSVIEIDAFSCPTRLQLWFMLGTSEGGFFMNNSPIPRFSKELSSLLNEVVQHIQNLENLHLDQDAYYMYVEKYTKQASDDIEMMRINYSMQYPSHNGDIFLVATKAQKQLGIWYEQIFPGRKCILTDALVAAASYVVDGPAMSLGGSFGFHNFQPYPGIVGIPVRTPLAEFNSPLFSFAVGKK
ncbi:PREDICTED: uncharacterized protein LOC108564568 [Nicrophorus vespilloides]|uniref:Uncharacterized protein LOC108564568 n=1 Tax=Nicrophorus vespilloides TaxID=110193 RepID=A0ABM1MX40_NICVS|nr:PREDICTED: uncharacterized protein LOC108564568 [Nicrophorus vespilloides]